MTFPYSRNWLSAVERGLVRLQQGFMFRVGRISEEQFREANERGKIQLLLQQFEKFMLEAGVNLNENLLCPYHDDHHPSMTYYRNTKKFYCHLRCFEEEVNDGSKKPKVHKDGLDIIRDLLDLKSFDESYNTLVTWFVENPKQFHRLKQPYRKSSGTRKASTTTSARKSTPRVLATEDPEVKQYLNARGIDDNMILLFDVGACEEAGIKLATVPCDNGFEARRNIHFQPKDEEDKNGKYLNPKGRAVALFNGQALKVATADMPVIAVESAFDAILIRSMGIPAVATNSPSTTRLVERCKAVANSDLRLILMFDFDGVGQKATYRAYHQLKRLVKVVAVPPSNPIFAGYLADFKDVGEAYLASKHETEKALNWPLKVVHFD